MKQFKIFLLIFLLTAIVNAGNTVSSKGAYPACTNEDTYSEFVSAITSSGNYDSLEIYARKGCTVIMKGTQLTIIERNWSTAKVMFLDPMASNRVIMYTAIEAVR